MEDVAANLARVRAEIATALQESKRPEGDARLVAVSKKQPLERVEAALAAGQRVFGENYVQEAKRRWEPLKGRYGDLDLHLIGALQSNKAEDAVALFDTIQTLDRPRLATALAKAVAKAGRRPRLLVQVNTGLEPQKAGVAPDELPDLLGHCRGLDLDVEGLMAIPPAGDDVAIHAALLAKLAKRHGLPEVSIGMSDDFGPAIRFGATIVRVGSAIFGERPEG